MCAQEQTDKAGEHRTFVGLMQEGLAKASPQSLALTMQHVFDVNRDAHVATSECGVQGCLVRELAVRTRIRNPNSKALRHAQHGSCMSDADRSRSSTPRRRFSAKCGGSASTSTASPRTTPRGKPPVQLLGRHVADGHSMQAATRITGQPDFLEGVRAAVVDKDRCPRWRPDRIDGVDAESVAALLECPDELRQALLA